MNASALHKISSHFLGKRRPLTWRLLLLAWWKVKVVKWVADDLRRVGWRRCRTLPYRRITSDCIVVPVLRRDRPKQLLKYLTHLEQWLLIVHTIVRFFGTSEKMRLKSVGGAFRAEETGICCQWSPMVWCLLLMLSITQLYSGILKDCKVKILNTFCAGIESSCQWQSQTIIYYSLKRCSITMVDEM